MQHGCGYSSLNKGIQLRRSPGFIAYPDALAQMDADVAALQKSDGPEVLWLLEHPPLYTAGVSAKPGDLLDPDRFPVFRSGRGGQLTYHGPGQRVAYIMLDLTQRGRDLRVYVQTLESWLIAALARLGVRGELRQGRVGVWVVDGGREAKIAAVGIKVSRWVSFHGVALNVAPDLSHFEGIVPCGIRDHGVTSLAALGIDVSMQSVDQALTETFAEAFGHLE